MKDFNSTYFLLHQITFEGISLNYLISDGGLDHLLSFSVSASPFSVSFFTFSVFFVFQVFFTFCVFLHMERFQGFNFN